MKKIIFLLASLLPITSCVNQANLTPIAETVTAVEADYAELADNFRAIILNSTLTIEQKQLLVSKIDGNAKSMVEKLAKIQTALREAGEVGTEYVGVLNQLLDAWVTVEGAKK